ncbi:glucosamine-6-phosphate deaminase [Brevibacillus massiliensis]|uniref:glucosamine-6-phosphate deaminase n=1 Tax=Brevibacillus massiliensis TaxID=1118054 RepID=UPI000684E162|nr:glucosamine-6-phosphate deaminase [Brevibacillus massiliensis]
MRLVITDDYMEMSRKAAEWIAGEMKQKPGLVLGLATGSTPIGMYKELIEMYRKGQIDFSQVTTFNLDEYVGLHPEHPQSYHAYMWKHFFSHININKEHVNIPPGRFENEKDVCSRYDEKIKKSGGIDIQILGIGRNGHIGFNEPDSSLSIKTHIVNLALETIEANSRFFPQKDEVPKQAITMGLGSIMEAKTILLLANGRDKAAAIAKTLMGKVSTQIPASLLQLHPNVTMIMDKEAACFVTENKHVREWSFAYQSEGIG